MARFDTIGALMDADAETLGEIEGVGPKIAEPSFPTLHWSRIVHLCIRLQNLASTWLPRTGDAAVCQGSSRSRERRLSSPDIAVHEQK